MLDTNLENYKENNKKFTTAIKEETDKNLQQRIYLSDIVQGFKVRNKLLGIRHLD